MDVEGLGLDLVFRQPVEQEAAHGLGAAFARARAADQQNRPPQRPIPGSWRGWFRQALGAGSFAIRQVVQPAPGCRSQLFFRLVHQDDACHSFACIVIKGVTVRQIPEDGFFPGIGMLHPADSQEIRIARVALMVVGFAAHFCKERLDILDLVINHFL